jgi:hypothetical protein
LAVSRKDATSEFAAEATIEVDVAKRARRPRKNAQEGVFKISTTAPEEIRRHNISDEELELLSGCIQDGLSDAFWALVGGALAVSPSAIAALWNAYFKKPPDALGALHLMEILILVGTLTPAIAIRLVNRSRRERAKDLVTRIRARVSH